MDIGAQLRHARESRGLSIATVAATTRIQPRALEGIERNDLSVVPPHPYDRGFVAAFAREVGLNPDEVVREYFGQFETEPVEIESPVQTIEDPPYADRLRSWAPAVGGVALVVLIAGLLLGGRGEAPNVGDTGVVGTTGNADADRAAPGTVLAAKPQADAAKASDVHLPSAPVVVVVLEADRPSWVTATVDGTRQLYQIVPAGTKTTLRGKEIAIRVGDAGAMRWSVNGRTPALMGASGQVRSVKLTPKDAGAD